MRLPWGVTLVAAVAAAALMLLIGSWLTNPQRALLTGVSFNPVTISPNADGIDDVTALSYTLSRPARVSLTFTDEAGNEFVFRQDAHRDPRSFRVLFSGVVDGFWLDGESPERTGVIERRLMPDGVYSWTLTAEDDDGRAMTETGTLTIADGDADLPRITEFSVTPETFSPNQDGVADRALINVYVDKAHESLEVYLVPEAGGRIPIARREEGRDEGEAGRHIYDYEGGVDIGADPPEDGLYTLVAEVQDAVGQRTIRTAMLEIVDGGKPRAEITAQDTGATVLFVSRPYEERFFSDFDSLGDRVEAPDQPEDFNLLPVTMMLGEMLVFRLEVENYGRSRIRTSGPPPGTVYQQTQRAATLNAMEQSGVWRVGIDCETAPESYPWRWALGDETTLEVEEDKVTGNRYLYLPAGESVVVWGAIRMTEYNEDANPQACWAGLIHEDVAISLENQNVGRREVELAVP